MLEPIRARVGWSPLPSDHHDLTEACRRERERGRCDGVTSQAAGSKCLLSGALMVRLFLHQMLLRDAAAMDP